MRCNMKKLIMFLGLIGLLSFPAAAELMPPQPSEDIHITDWLNEDGEPILDEPYFTEWSADVLFAVQKFKDLLKTGSPQLIAQNVIYPYKLGRGVPSIKTEQEFIEKFNIILPKQLRKYLIESPMEHWSYNAYKGNICLYWCFNGEITPNGKIVSVKTIKKLREYRKEYIEKEKQTIHPSVKNYNYNLYTMRSKEWLIRIDDMNGVYKPANIEEDPKENYRFVAWRKGKTISDEPDIVIDRGSKSVFANKWISKFTFVSDEYYCTFEDKAQKAHPQNIHTYSLHLYKGLIAEAPEVE